MIFWTIAILLTAMYCILMLYYLVGWTKLPDFKSSDVQANGKVISVLIPARNEEHVVCHLLESILYQTLPIEMFEVILIDDHSSDATVAVAEAFATKNGMKNFKTISLADAGQISQAYKKKAIEYGIQNANGLFIVTTDADCIVPPNWLVNLLSFQQQNGSKMIAAPVKYSYDSSFFQQFQALDFTGLIGITGASIAHGFNNMCNGANLFFEKSAFEAVNGYRGNDNISSGDDMFLMHKLAQQFPGKIHFLKSNDACVITTPKHSVFEFLHQRLRWTSKSTSYSDKRITAILVMAYLFNLSILVFTFLNWKIALMELVLKSMFEYLLLKRVVTFFNQKKLLGVFLLSQPIHILYILSVGLLGQVGSFKWKGRRMNK